MSRSIWLDAMEWFRRIDGALPRAWPAELPPESDPSLWALAARLEMQQRSATSKKIQRMITEGAVSSSVTPLDLWFYRRRVEWAAQLILTKAQEGIEPDATLCEVLEWALIRSWETDGCIGFWNHAIERGGRPHPENADGLSPV